MSTVSNPYTFNIKSDCGFSTNALISDNTYRAKLTMVYYPNGESNNRQKLIYSNNTAESDLTPNIINGVRITSIGLQLESDNKLYCSLLVDGKMYSKLILNGGPFINFEIYYSQLIAATLSVYEYHGDVVGTNPDYWSFYDGFPFDFTIEFVE